MDLPKQLPQAVLRWYDAGHRDLPWRHDREPYHVWLSEVMLQQTRVEAVKGYYERFLEALPTVEALAECPEDKLEKLWEGLGYYSRVRNLQKAAKVIVERYSGIFPRTYEEVLALPGIGPYTAGAICSICFDLPTPAVDGNVLRLAARLTADETPIDRSAFRQQVMEELQQMYHQRPGDLTQALMELGATLCGPNRAAECDQCPCQSFCVAAREGIADRLPVRTPKKDKWEEALTVFLLRCGDRFALQRRPRKGLLAGLWQLPNVPGTLETPEAVTAVETMGLSVKQICYQSERSHIFTHIRWQMRLYCMEVTQQTAGFQWLTEKEITDSAALPTAFRQFWEHWLSQK